MKMTPLLRLSLLVAVALLTLGAPTAAWATDHKPAACADHTPHKIRMVKVAPGVELEVLDWGGKGKAMVLLTGGGDNAHVYDEFALPVHRLLSCRSGSPVAATFPRASRGTATTFRPRAADDIAVLDALGIDKAVFVGHSAAGTELSRLGQAYRRASTSWSTWMLPTCRKR